MKKILLVIVLALLSLGAGATLRLRQPCSDGMILQQNSTATVWGFASPGASITVTTSWNGRSYKVRADGDGIWRAGVQTPAASYRSYEVRVSGDGGSLTIRDVLVGEVWLAGGQSNMEMTLSGKINAPIEHALEAISAPPARNKVRMFIAPKTHSVTPLDEVAGSWLYSDPADRPQMAATGYFFAEKLNAVLDVPVGVVSCPFGGSRVEGWLPREELEKYPDVDLSPEGLAAKNLWLRPMIMYNAMLYPLAGWTVKGILYYQGCSNVGEEATYADRLVRMVEIWRDLFNDPDAQLPFYEVEIAPYAYGAGQNGHAALLRAAQHEAAGRIPNAGIVVTNDLVSPEEYDNIHPSRKQPIGERLACLALNRQYGYSAIPCESPRALRAYREEGKSGILVECSCAEWGLYRTHGIKGLEVCGPDGRFLPVSDVQFDSRSRAMSISHPEVADIVEVRYGWGDFVPGNLADIYLPFAPFDLKVAQ